MRGLPLSVLIDNRVRYMRQQGEDVDLAREIRRVMETVEEVARFRAPKYLACYSDLVQDAAQERGDTLPEAFPDITMMLELGVPRTTDMSLINLGLSRASALAVAGFITDENLTPEQVRAWILERDISALGIPPFAVREVSRVLELHDGEDGTVSDAS